MVGGYPSALRACVAFAQPCERENQLLDYCLSLRQFLPDLAPLTRGFFFAPSGRATPRVLRAPGRSARSAMPPDRARSDRGSSRCCAVACVMLAFRQSVSEAKQKSRSRPGTVRSAATDSAVG